MELKSLLPELQKEIEKAGGEIGAPLRLIAKKHHLSEEQLGDLINLLLTDDIEKSPVV